MKIGIDISQIIYGTGVSFYTRNLVKGLSEIDKKNDYLLVGTSLRQKKKLIEFASKIKKLNPRFASRIFSLPISLAEAFGNRGRFFSLEKIIGSVDVWHSSDWIQPPTQAAKVTTIHDFGFWRYPQTAHPKILAVMNRRLKLVKKEVDRVICVSQTTAQDAQDYLEIPIEKLKVIYEAPGDEFKPVSLSQVNQVKAKYQIKGDYLLAVSTIEPRKNFPAILEAFVTYLKENSNLSLVIVGKLGWDKAIARLMKKTDRVILTGYVPTCDLAALYSGAFCFLYPSLYEGFGIPVLEAMKCGCPVVTANVSSMPELAGKSAILVNPLKVADIVRGIGEVAQKRDELIKRGLARVKKFTWQKTAQKTLKVYEEASRLH